MYGMLRYIFCLLLVFESVISAIAQGNSTGVDSTFWLISLPELQNYRTYYVQELELLQEEKQNLIRKGIEDGERLLQQKPDEKIVDEILIRLADLYYYQEKDDYLARMAVYDEQLLSFARGEIASQPEEPSVNYEKSLQIYQRIIDEFPQSDLVDDAIYNKGFLYEEMEENDKANQIYLYLIDAYPKSVYVPESYMRLGEFYFNPPQNDLDRAISYYKKVLSYRNSLRYNEALYKLGWSYYRLSKYPEAISYFTSIVENIQAVEKYDPAGIQQRVDLIQEAIAYIAICFIDFGGPGKIYSYLTGMGKPDWGQDALQKLGDVYMSEKEEYGNAIQTYARFLDYAPESARAPVIQKKIIDCYQSLNDDARAFDNRQRLFLTYKSDGAWWNQIKDDQAKLTAYQLTEQALRDNINYMIGRAEEISSESIYRKIVELGQVYLDAFPEDIHAYMIRWNIALILDTRLHDYKKALQEYLTISMVYTGSEYEKFARMKGLATAKDAAENAIVVADTLVQRELKTSGKDVTVQLVVDNKNAIPLTTAESWLAMAYDNYIKRFPFDSSTPAVLANAGALYYTRNQFSEALKYFKTLTKYFPESDQIKNVQYSILESYFGKKDYASAEVLAKRIINSDASEDIKKKVRNRLGEAIFLNAQQLAAEGQSSVAASEFYRMALETPTLEFADRALFNAGREFEKNKQYESAVRAYELLRASYSGSALLADALNNLAFDYGEINDFQKGGDRYESLAILLNDGKGAKDALYNAIVFYEKAGSWRKAINVSQKYAQLYPDSSDAAQVYFKVGEFYSNLNEDKSASYVYEGFADLFPDSPLGVEAYYRLGNYYSGQKMTDRALNAYYRAYTTSQKLKSKGIDENVYFAAEGLFLATQLLFDRYQTIEFRLPESSIAQSLQEKQSLSRQLIDQYTTVIAYKTRRLPESLFCIGKVYEEFATSWSRQEVPTMNSSARAVREKEINNRTTRIYGEALTAYRKAIRGLNTLKSEMTLATTGNKDSTASSADSLIVLIGTWFQRSKDKVTEILYQMGEVNFRSAERLVAVPVPAELQDMAKLEYRRQVLVQAVKPLLDVVVEAHWRNLSVADSLQIENQWTRASRDKILSVLNIPIDQLVVLSFDALNIYGDNVDRFREITLVQKSQALEEVLNSMVNCIELSNSYSRMALAFVKDGLLKAETCHIVPEKISHMQETASQFLLALVDSIDHNLETGVTNKNKAGVLYENTGDLIFEECLAAFEDNVYFLNEFKKNIMETAFSLVKDFQDRSSATRWIGVRLVELDPQKYAPELNIPVRTIAIFSDTTWWYSSFFHENWEHLEGDMLGWRHPRFSSTSAAPPDSAIDNSGSLPNPKGDLYIRTEFNIPGHPVFGQIQFQSDFSHEVYLNSGLVTEEVKQELLTVTDFLQNGKNRLAIKYTDNGKFIFGEQIRVQYIPQVALPN